MFSSCIDFSYESVIEVRAAVPYKNVVDRNQIDVNQVNLHLSIIYKVFGGHVSPVILITSVKQILGDSFRYCHSCLSYTMG